MFNPDIELTDFCGEFSQNYLELKPGDYFSKNNKYHIRYLTNLVPSTLSSQSEELKTICRVCNKSGVMELSKSKLSDPTYTTNFVFYLLMWCAIRYSMVQEKSEYSNELDTDKIAIEYYISKKLPLIDVRNGCKKQFSDSKSSLNDLRMEYLHKIKID